MNEPEIIVAELKLPVSVDTLAAIADALGAVHGKGNLFIRPSGAVFRIFKRGAKEGVNTVAIDRSSKTLLKIQGEVAPGGFSKTLIKLQDLLARAEHQLDKAQYQLGACCAAARGEPLPPEVLPASPALDEVIALRREFENLIAGIS